MTKNNETALTPVGAAQRALAEAVSVQDFKDVRDAATAAKTWVKARALGIGSENEATEVILRAERSIGSILSTVERDRGTGSAGTGPRRAETPLQEALAAIDLSVSQAQRFMSLARLSDETFENLLSANRESHERLAKVNFYRGAETKFKAEQYVEPGSAFVAALRHVAAEAERGMQSVPGDELLVVKDLIQSLVDAFVAEKVRRGNAD